MAELTQAKAKKILRDKMVRGEPLSEAQKGFFGLVAGGGKPTRLKTGFFHDVSNAFFPRIPRG